MRKDGNHLLVEGGAFKVPITLERKSYQNYVDKPVVLGIRPEDIFNPAFVPPGIHAAPIEAKVDVTELMGNEIFLYMLSGTTSFVARVDPRTRFQVNEKVQMVLNMDNMHVFDQETERAIR